MAVAVLTVAVATVAVVTVEVVTVVIVTSFSKKTWHLDNRWDVLGAAFCDSCDVFFVLPLQVNFF